MRNYFFLVQLDLCTALCLCNYMDNYSNQKTSDKWYPMDEFEFLLCMKLEWIDDIASSTNWIPFDSNCSCRYQQIFYRLSQSCFFYFDEVPVFKQLCNKQYMPRVWYFLLWLNSSPVASNMNSIVFCPYVIFEFGFSNIHNMLVVVSYLNLFSYLPIRTSYHYSYHSF